jgi:vacuolar-type H+-ATPase subunit D/Vma8
MSEITPTRSAVLELKDELRAMREGYAFLDEKCLMLAAEILRELVRYQKLDAALQDVLIPEISGTLYELEARLEELEQEDALWMRLNR